MATKHSRREFLKRAAAGFGAAAAAPYVVPDTVMGAGEAASPSERVTCAILGCGGRGRSVLRHFMRQRDVQWIAASDCRADRLAAAKKQVDQTAGNADCATYADFREMLGRPDLDALLIATGNRWHAFASIYAARAGKDMYCEKPISLTIAEGRALVETTARLGTIYQAGYQRHSVDSFRFQAECVHEKRIGDLKEIICQVWTARAARPSAVIPVPEGFDYDTWLGPTPWHPFTWSRVNGWTLVWDTSGGVITDMGCHWTDIAQWGNQTEDTGPVAIDVLGVTWPPPASLTEVPISAKVALTYANGVRCIMQSTGGFNQRFVRFVGTEGWIQIDDATNRVTCEPASLLKVRGISAKGWGDPGDHVRNFLDGVKTRRRTVCHPESAHRAMSLCQLANIALRTGRNLRWDPDQERFIDCDEANRMISRAVRPPWHL